MIIVLRAGHIGTLRGLWVEGLRLVTLGGAVAVGANLTTALAVQAAAALPLDLERIEAITFFSLTVIAGIVLAFVSRQMGRLVKQHAMVLWNQVMGALLGLGSGALLAGLTVWALRSLPWAYMQVSIMERSWSGALVIRLIQAVARVTALISGGVSPSSHFFGGS